MTSIDENARIKRLIDLDKNTVPPNGGQEYNRLIFSASPYLLQHAENPVDWYPWGDEAFRRAATENKPVFLSIGYATCHWCHVMAHESFEDRKVAAVFNRHFVCIKVDREERPDIDDYYMTSAQVMEVSGGWPLSVFMTPRKVPFFVTTYVPRESRMGMPGIISLLERVAELWQTQQNRLVQDGATILAALARQDEHHHAPEPDRDTDHAAFNQLAGMFDSEWGGFGRTPKFPMPVYMSFLLRYWRKSGEATALAMIEQTLRALRQGGIWDQLGYGFHRYATDRQWLVPHFEKMLYDQALLADAALEVWQATGTTFYLRIAEEIFSCVTRELTNDDGGFVTALDADSEGEEGRFYLWTRDELDDELGEDASLFCRLFGVTDGGNFEERNILHLPVAFEEFAQREGGTPEELLGRLEQWRETLLMERDRRIRPLRDDKVLTAWNGLMIAALARGYAVTGTGCYLEAAQRAADFIAVRMTDSSGRLLRSSLNGVAAVPAFLEDYAFYIRGLIELHQVTLNPKWLHRAVALTREQQRLFLDEVRGGFYDTGMDAEVLPVRRKSLYDGAIPSGNGIAAFNLFRLGRISDDDRLVREGERTVAAYASSLARQPVGFLYLLMAREYHLGPEVIVTLAGKREALGDMLRQIHGRFLPGLAIRYAGEDGSGGFPAIGGRPTAYICAAGACRPPVTEVTRLGTMIDEVT